MEKFLNFKMWIKYGFFRDKRDGCIYEPGPMLVIKQTNEVYYAFCTVDDSSFHLNKTFTKREVFKNFVKVSKNEEMAIYAKRSLLNDI